MKQVRHMFVSPMAVPMAVATAFLLAGCNVLSGGSDVEYKSAAKVEPLEVPPDLIKPSRDDRFTLPASGSASRSEFDRQRIEPRRAESNQVLPSVSGMRIERQGDQRVLVVDQPADKLWPVVRQFWIDNGFALAIENPETGLLETDWAENRAKIPEDIIRRTLGKVFDRLYDTGERDKFRTRLDRVNGQQTEIAIAHRGVVEMATSGDRFTWTNTPPDRQLEAEFLRRLMLRLGADKDRADTLIAQSAVAPSSAQIVRTGKSSVIEMSEPFDRAWRRVGVAIDRLGFTVEDRDRAAGAFFVRYRDPTAELEPKKSGFFGNLFSSKKTSDSVEQYQVRVVSVGDQQSRVVVLDRLGKETNNADAQRMLTVIFDQLK
jgi:outer membrane protein assembly factor BamC